MKLPQKLWVAEDNYRGEVVIELKAIGIKTKENKIVEEGRAGLS